jgi:hypothetical protein
MGVLYATDVDVKRAVDIAATANADAQIRRALEAASRSIDGTRPGQGLLRRRFYPEIATRYFSTVSTRATWQLPLGRYELISATTVVSGGTTISASDYYLQPENDGPPYDQIDLKQTSYSAWPGGSGQRGVVITGLWGYRADEATAGALAAAISSTSATTCNVTDSSAIGVGTILRVDSERLIVTGRALLTTTQTLQVPVGATEADKSIAVTTGSAFFAGETIVLDSETMLITAVAGNTLVVERAYDGSTLAAHTGSTIYAPRTLTVERGALGTSAATHTNSTAIARHVVPVLVASLCVAEAINQLEQEGSAYARRVRSGDAEFPASGAGLQDIRNDAIQAHRRRLTWLGV